MNTETHAHLWGPDGCYCGAKQCGFHADEFPYARCKNRAPGDLISKDRCEEHQRPRECSNCGAGWCDGTRCL